MRRVIVAQGFCPCCYRHPKQFEKVSLEDKRIDSLQVSWSSRNYLRVLDLSRPGKPCEKDDKTCCVRCLVCGESVIDWDEHNFQRVRRFVNCDTDRPVTAKDIEDDILVQNWAVITRRWKTPVHFGCTYLAQRGLRLALGDTKCPKQLKQAENDKILVKEISSVCIFEIVVLPDL